MNKKLLTTALVLGLIAVPSFVVAQQSIDDPQSTSTNTVNEVSREDRQDDRRADVNPHQQVPVANQSNTAKLETEASISGESISRDEAISIAQRKMPGATIEKLTVETEHGAIVYSIRFTNEARVDVRASDGEIVRSKL